MHDGTSYAARRLLCWLNVIGLGVLGFAFLAPQGYWTWVGYRNRERFYQGKPTSYWSAVLRKPTPGWAQYLPTGTHWLVGLGGYPAVLQGDPAAVPVLLELLKDEDWHVRWEAFSNLTQMPNLPVALTDVMMPLLNDDHAELRTFCAERFATLCPDATIVVPALLPLLKDEDQRVRQRITSTLAGFGSKANVVVPALCERVRDRSERPSVRSSACRALARMGSAAQPALPVLREALQDGEVEVRVAAATVLWHISGQEAAAVPILRQALKHPNMQVRHQTVEGLGVLSPHAPGIVPILIEALTDAESWVRSPACGLLERVSRDAKEQAREVLEPLARLLREETHAGTLKTAIRALGHLGPEAVRTVPSLATILQRHDPFLRLEAARALSAMGPAAKDAVPALLAAYQRETPLVAEREAVISALHRIDAEAAARNAVP